MERSRFLARIVVPNGADSYCRTNDSCCLHTAVETLSGKQLWAGDLGSDPNGALIANGAKLSAKGLARTKVKGEINIIYNTVCKLRLCHNVVVCVGKGRGWLDA